MSRRRNAALRCEKCRMHNFLCVCSLVPRIVTDTRLLLVIHRFEDRKPTNTGRLAASCLVNSEIVLRGDVTDANLPLPIPEATQPVLLFPAEDAMPLVDMAPKLAAAGKPVTLIVPDGNWRQAFKVRNRVPGLDRVPCATLPTSSEPSIYRLRSEAHEHGLATLEAIARAFGVLEGPEVREAMEKPFRVMVERTLWSRGLLPAERVSGGIPAGGFE